MKAKDSIVIGMLILLVLISGLLLYSNAASSVPVKWEYKIEGIKDHEWEKGRAAVLGGEGWEIVTCRRARTENDAESEDYYMYGSDMMLYECIFKRQTKKAPTHKSDSNGSDLPEN